MGSKAYYQNRIIQCENDIRGNNEKIQILWGKIEGLKSKKAIDIQYLDERNSSFLKFQDAKSKGVTLYGERLRSHVNSGAQLTLCSYFDGIDTNIRRKIRLLKEENSVLQREIDYCKAEIARIEREEKEEEERQKQLVVQA